MVMSGVFNTMNYKIISVKLWLSFSFEEETVVKH